MHTKQQHYATQAVNSPDAYANGEKLASMKQLHAHIAAVSKALTELEASEDKELMQPLESRLTDLKARLHGTRPIGQQVDGLCGVISRCQTRLAEAEIAKAEAEATIIKETEDMASYRTQLAELELLMMMMMMMTMMTCGVAHQKCYHFQGIKLALIGCAHQATVHGAQAVYSLDAYANGEKFCVFETVRVRIAAVSNALTVFGCFRRQCIVATPRIPLDRIGNQTAWSKTDCTTSRLAVGVVSRCLLRLADVESAKTESRWCPVM